MAGAIAGTARGGAALIWRPSRSSLSRSAGSGTRASGDRSLLLEILLVGRPGESWASFGWSEGVARQVAETFRGVQASDQEKPAVEAFRVSFAKGLRAAVCKRVTFSLVGGPESGVGSANVSRSKAYRDRPHHRR